MKSFDAVIIGFGKGGKTLAGWLGGQGKEVAIVEQSDKMYGGTCINVSCIPTKSLVTSAKLAQAALERRQEPVTFAERARLYREAVAEKARLTGMLRKKNYNMLNDNPNVTVFDGKASFTGPKEIQIEGRDGIVQIRGEKVFINTGSTSFLPPIEGLKESSHVYTSATLMDLEELPAHLVIIGGGYIGLEYASFYAGFGAKVTVLQDMDRFIPREDADIAAEIQQVLEQKGVTIRTGVQVKSIHDQAGKAMVAFTQGGREESLSAQAVLVATGRRPNTAELNLGAAGIETTPRGAVKVDAQLRATAPDVWAMGDVAGGLQFTYISLDDFRIVRSQLMEGAAPRSTETRPNVPYSVFLDPAFSRVGLNEQEALEQGYKLKIAKLPAAAIPKAQVLRETNGLLKAVVDADTGLILGAMLFCAESYEMINTVKLAMDTKLPYTFLRDQIFTHPTMSEALNDLFGAIR